MGTHFHNLLNQNPLVRAIHTAVKGRARYKVNGLSRSESLKRYLELRLSKEEGIGQVRANHDTGNVLVLFHSDFSPNAIASLLERIVLDYRKQGTKLPVRTAYISTAPEEAKNLSINTRKLNQLTASVQKQESTQTHVKKQLEQAGSQLILVSGTAVSTLVLCTGLLHKYGLDERILLAIQKLHTPLLDRIMLGITSFGDPVFLVLICLALQTGLLYHNRRTQAITLSIAAIGAVSLNCFLKLLFGRARPDLWNWIIDVGQHSFPSGHAMVSIVIYGFLGYILAKEFPQWRGRIFALTVVLIVAIGFSRLYLGVHWPTDVVAGYAVGLVWLIACIKRMELREKYYSSAKYLYTILGLTHSHKPDKVQTIYA
ncbi:phosphatase PAP2 family protein [Brasilonema bromeliae]|uniref:PA-phosphatase n=1 Tax=Brasilonema bromeliae SPC951 TaxID=385972 RepID=A0ABX1PBS8_9CYAN|nr:phosphatase PAP2 family protein [Brasilonema bromeliae]NMG21929.1 PA-phosphatase [Brasilonema bromeliae SPC951]